MDTFDLIDSQNKARQIASPRELLEVWEAVSRLYVRQKIARYDLDEMKATVWEQFRRIRVLKRLKDNPKLARTMA
jgi:hypothetical protein